MSNKQNDILVDNLIDRMENLGIFELLVSNDKGFKIKDLELLEKYTSFFEDLNPLENEDGEGNEYYFWCIDKLKNKVRIDRQAPIIKKALEQMIDTDTEYGTVKAEDNKKQSIIL